MQDGAGNDIESVYQGDGSLIGTIYQGDGTVLWTDSAKLPEQNLVAHWDMSELNLNDGEAISTVPDQSGNGHDLSGQGPTFAENGINGNPSARLDGTDDDFLGPGRSEVDLSSDTAVYSVYIVWQSLDASHTGYIMTQTTSTERSEQPFAHLYGSGVDFSIGGEVTENTAIDDENKHTTAALVDRTSNDANVSWDGSLESATVGGETSSRSIRIGSRGGAVYFDGYVGECLIYDEQHGQAVHNDVINYLSRWD